MNNLSEESRRQAQETAKQLQVAMEQLRQGFLKACDSLQKFVHEGGHNITPHTDKAPKHLDWMKANPMLVPLVKESKAKEILDHIDGYSPKITIHDELIEWLNEQRAKQADFKHEYMGKWVDVTPAPFSQHELDLEIWRMERMKRIEDSKPREDDPELFGTFGYELMGIDLGKGEENGND